MNRDEVYKLVRDQGFVPVEVTEKGDVWFVSTSDGIHMTVREAPVMTYDEWLKKSKEDEQ